MTANSFDPPTAVELLILEAIYSCYRNYGTYPTNSELLSKVNENGQMSQQQLTNYKGFLREKGLIRNAPGGRYELTDRGRQALGPLSRYSVAPAEMLIHGEVKAGSSDPGDLVVDEYLGDGENTLLVPNADPERETYALQVVGTSMEEEGIREGDYIIVESYRDNAEVREGDLIVTKFLPESYINADEEMLLNAIEDPEEYAGPTLKYCYIIRNPLSTNYRYDGKVQTRNVYRLSQRRVKLVEGEVDKGSTIITSHIKPMGKVIGVYRSLRG
jgi:SOS-response transcriptional repressor LexA